MTARYAIYDPRTDKDLGEFGDLPDAYAEIDRLRNLHGPIYGVRIAREHRAQIDRAWEIQKVRTAVVSGALLPERRG